MSAAAIELEPAWPTRRAYLPGRWRRKNARSRDVDPIVVERLIDGTLTVATIPTCAEIQAAIDYLDGHRLPAHIIAARIGCTTRTVYRARARRKEAA